MVLYASIVTDKDDVVYELADTSYSGTVAGTIYAYPPFGGAGCGITLKSDVRYHVMQQQRVHAYDKADTNIVNNQCPQCKDVQLDHNGCITNFYPKA